MYHTKQKDFRERFILPFNVLGIDLHMLVGNHDIIIRIQVKSIHLQNY